MTSTFFNVSAAVHSRPSGRACFEFIASTSVSMVGVSGVSTTSAAGTPDASTGAACGTTTASTLAAYPPGERTKVSSPFSAIARNSSDREPPIAPDIALTIT
jgi:hypothetical protein